MRVQGGGADAQERRVGCGGRGGGAPDDAVQDGGRHEGAVEEGGVGHLGCLVFCRWVVVGKSVGMYVDVCG